MGSRGGEDAWQSSGWRTREGNTVAGGPHVPYLCADKPGETTVEGERQDN